MIVNGQVVDDRFPDLVREADRLARDDAVEQRQLESDSQRKIEATARGLVGLLDRMGTYSLHELEIFLTTLLVLVKEAGARESNRETPVP